MKRRTFVLFCAAGLVLPGLHASGAGRAQPEPVPAAVRYDGDFVARVLCRTPRELLAVSTLTKSVWSERSGLNTPFDAQFSADKRAALDDLGVPYEVLIADVQARVEAERADIAARRADKDLAWFGNYKTLAEIDGRLTTLAAANPTRAATFNVGSSHQSRAIRGIRITGPGDTSTRPILFFNATQHAREWISPMTAMFIADQLLERYPTDTRVRNIVDRVEFHIVPVVNPDGYEYSWTTERLWRKNRRNNGDGSFGVDLNRNWGYQWGVSGSSSVPSNDTYKGPSPMSEPEVAAVGAYMQSLPRLVGSIDFHSYSQLILWPYSYAAVNPPQPDLTNFQNLGASMRQSILSAGGVTYSAIRSADLYASAGDMNDWAYQTLGSLGYTYELRDTGTNGFILPAAQIVPTGQEIFAAMLTYAEYFAFPIRFTFASPLPARVEPDQTNPVRADISVTGAPLDPASVKLYARVGGGAFQQIAMSNVSGATFEGALPAAGCGLDIQYYFEARNTLGAVERSPADAPLSFYAATARQSLPAFNDACESAVGWTVGAPGDTATAGLWENADPQPTSAQPGDDRSPTGTRCWVTDGRAGAAVGTYDVDGGSTTLTSPRFSLAGAGAGFLTSSASISYWVWYSNNLGGNSDDTMLVQISDDDGGTWAQLDLLSTSTAGWVQRTPNLPNGIDPTTTMRLRFVARDLGAGSVVEAAVDDIASSVIGCPRSPADINGDGTVDLADFFEFFNCYDAEQPCADIDANPGVDLGDFFEFFNYYDQAG